MRAVCSAVALELLRRRSFSKRAARTNWFRVQRASYADALALKFCVALPTNSDKDCDKDELFHRVKFQLCFMATVLLRDLTLLGRPKALPQKAPLRMCADSIEDKNREKRLCAG